MFTVYALEHEETIPGFYAVKIKDEFNFPVGEPHIKLDIDKRRSVGIPVFIKWEIVPPKVDVMSFLLLCDALKRSGYVLRKLELPYVPFGRQDKPQVLGEPLSLRVFCDLVNHVGFGKVLIKDPHSDVTPALLDNCTVITQAEVFGPLISKIEEDFWLVSPDAGESKKIYDSASKNAKCMGIVKCDKRRDLHTGKIIDLDVHVPCACGGPDAPGTANLIVLDDICDGGATYVTLANKLKKYIYPKKITLLVTHGFFTRGLGVFDGLIDEIYTHEGRVK